MCLRDSAETLGDKPSPGFSPELEPGPGQRPRTADAERRGCEFVWVEVEDRVLAQAALDESGREEPPVAPAADREDAVRCDRKLPELPAAVEL